MAKQYLTVGEINKSIRADKFLAVNLTNYSRSALAKLFDLNLIKLNGASIKVGDRLKSGQTIEYDIGPLTETPEVIELPLIYEDENVIVVDKPAGIISHARGRFWQEASVASFIRDKVKDIPGERAGIVHRLDRATSGVMMCAKNEQTLKYLQKQFHDRLVIKKYIAIVEAGLKNDQAMIDAPISRNPTHPKQFMVDATGKHAVTKYKILKSNDNFSKLELKPETGRTHQLRVHLKYLNKPVVGDELYDGKKADRLMLHAKELTIKMSDGKKKKFTSKLPKEFGSYI